MPSMRKNIENARTLSSLTIAPILYHRQRAPSTPTMSEFHQQATSKNNSLTTGASLTNIDMDKQKKTTKIKNNEGLLKAISCLHLELSNSEEIAMEFCQKKLPNYENANSSTTITIKQNAPNSLLLNNNFKDMWDRL